MESTPTVASRPRDRYRQQVQAEIRTLAWQQIADSGAGNLSLKAIARALGMSGPAIYRYVASRDELLSELIETAYLELGQALQGALDETTEATPVARVQTLAVTFRAWALDQPHRYLLLFGTPVPGYAAPPSTQQAAMAVMGTILNASGQLPEQAGGLGGAASALDVHLAGHHDWAVPALPPAGLRRALQFWTRLHGVVSLEVAGQFATMGFDPELLFRAEVESLLGF